MVTTRSADKRLDASREEDLVLRSRRIGSPRSTLSTPSRTSKRTASAVEDVGSTRAKRPRSELDDRALDGAFHVVVNVPIKSTSSQGQKDSHGPTKEADSTHESGSNLDDEGLLASASIQATPMSAPTANIETPPDQENDTFRTPATTRYKRFDSEEVDDDDTLLVSTAVDSTATQGYQTAEEEIGDSDNDAPEIETTKLAPTLPSRKSARTPRAKKTSRQIVSNTGGDSDAIEVVFPQTSNTSSASGSVINTTIAEHDKSPNEDSNDPVLVYTSQEQQTKSVARPLADQDHHRRPDTDTENLLHDTPRESPSINDAPVARKGAGVKAKVTLKSSESDPVLADSRVSLGIIMSGTETSSLRSTNPSAHTFDLSSWTQMQDTGSTLMSNAVRLPLKPNSSLSSYRRDKLQQKVAGSAGAIRMQNDWSKKRSSFVVS